MQRQEIERALCDFAKLLSSGNSEWLQGILALYRFDPEEVISVVTENNAGLPRIMIRVIISQMMNKKHARKEFPKQEKDLQENPAGLGIASPKI